MQEDIRQSEYQVTPLTGTSWQQETGLPDLPSASPGLRAGAYPAPAARAPVLSEGAEPATSPPGQWECWTPSGTVPCGYTLAVAGVSPVDAWAVGTVGTIMHWDGSFWQSVASPTTASLTAVSMVSAFDGWAVGAQGVILHWNGVAWRQVDSPTTEYLTSVDMVSATDGWAVGGQGVILHWDGVAWNCVESPTTQYLTSVDMVSAVDGWAVGVSGVIMHWDGVAWSLVTSPTEAILWSVSMASATDGWAVGGYGTILHWDGIRWIEVSATPGICTRCRCFRPSTDGLWATMARFFTGTAATGGLCTSPTTDDLYAVSMAADNAGWAVGRSFPRDESDSVQD